MQTIETEVSIFESAFNPRPIQNMNVTDVVKTIKSPMFKTYIGSLRELIAEHGIESSEYKSQKTHLSAFTLSGTFTRRNKKEMISYSTYVQGDIDKLNEQQAIELRDAIKHDPHILFGFISPSGCGVKFGFLSPDKESHEKQFYRFKKYFLNKYNIDAKHWDDSTKDISKLCFFSWDEDAFFNQSATLYHCQEEEPVFFDASTYIYKEHTTKCANYADEILRAACEAIEIAPDGQRHTTRLKRAYVVAGYVAGGHIDHHTALTSLIAAATKNTDNARDAERAIKAAYNDGLTKPLEIETRQIKIPTSNISTNTQTENNTVDDKQKPILQTKIDSNGNEKAHPNVPNVRKILQAWYGKRLRYESFQHQIQVDTIENGVQEWDDVHSQKVLDRLQETIPGMEMIKKDIIDTAVRLCADKNQYNGLTTWLDSLHWDGIERLDRWLIDYVGAEDNEYIRCVGRKWIIGAIARAYQPGIKFDYMLVLEGLQGMGKSTLFSVLSNGWFLDDLKSFEGREAAEKLQGTWIVEVAELNGFKKSDSEAIKSFITRQVDRYRPPYGKFAIDRKRSCVFAGTTNQDTYLKDVTGNRRFWPVKCSTVNIDGLKKNRDQLLAEAIYRYHDGEELTLPEDLFAFAANEQEQRLETDAWEEVIAVELDTKNPLQVTTTEILRDYLGIDVGRQTRFDQMRVGNIMAMMNGWCRKKVRRGQKLVWAYVPTDI